MNWRVNSGLFILLLIYVTVGALVLYVLEYETYTPADITQLAFFNEFLGNHSSVSASDLEAFTRSVVEAGKDGGVVGAAGEQDNGWTYDNSVYFAITVVSTIGYGHITPKTNGGKVFCIFFALVGIPIAGALLAGVATHLRRPLGALHRARPWLKGDPNKDRRLKSVVVLSLGLVFMLCIPALVFTFTEDWDYLSALYYSTVTLTTVGFGDYVASGGTTGEMGRVYRILMCVWLAVGLAFVAIVISEVSDLYSKAGDTESNDEKEDIVSEHTENKANNVWNGSAATMPL